MRLGDAASPQECRASPLDADRQSRRRAFLQHIAAEAKERRGSAARLQRHVARRLDNGRGLDEPAKILLVQASAGERLDAALQSGWLELRANNVSGERDVLADGRVPPGVSEILCAGPG